jgi:hypothetical protein
MDNVLVPLRVQLSVRGLPLPVPVGTPLPGPGLPPGGGGEATQQHGGQQQRAPCPLPVNSEAAFRQSAWACVASDVRSTTNSLPVERTQKEVHPAHVGDMQPAAAAPTASLSRNRESSAHHRPSAGSSACLSNCEAQNSAHQQQGTSAAAAAVDPSALLSSDACDHSRTPPHAHELHPSMHASSTGAAGVMDERGRGSMHAQPCGTGARRCTAEDAERAVAGLVQAWQTRYQQGSAVAEQDIARKTAVVEAQLSLLRFVRGRRRTYDLVQQLSPKVAESATFVGALYASHVSLVFWLPV